jgi:WD40 repeat protein
MGSIRIFSPQLQPTHEFQGKGGAVLVMQFHPNYQKMELYCGGEDCLVRVYDLVINKMVRKVEMQGFSGLL